jgi:hypothetical protein
MADTAVTAVPTFALDAERLTALADGVREGYQLARPFPHVVIDGFMPEEVLENVLAEFPAPDAIPWDVFTDHGHTRKLATERQALMGPWTRHVLHELNSGPMIEFLERLTGIDGLLPDPHMFGGGLHQIEPGGFLDVHADFNYYDRLRLDRRLNALLYLNRDWPEEFGGHLELWNRDMSACEQRVLPVFNRLVVFSTTSFSFHGHPVPVRCPAPRTRRSLAAYYYSNGRPEAEAMGVHSTLYQQPGVAPDPVAPRVVAEPPAPVATSAPATPRVRPAWQYRLKPFLPPAAVDLARRVEGLAAARRRSGT